MLFNSYIFILLFLPIAVTGYFLFNHFHKDQLAKVFLLGMSLWFYSYFNVKYLPVILLSIGLNYLAGLFLLREGPGKAVRRLVFLIALLANIGALFYFKYFDFFLENLNTALKTDFNLLHLALPLGISFFTFQQLAFLIDSYRRDVPKYPFLDYALFVAFFPKILQGPIALHSEMIPQFQDAARKSFCYENFSKGLMAVAFGLAKKVLLADTFGKLVDWGYADVGALDTVSALLVMLAYTLQIYFDFSGYSDMAIGLGEMFGFHFKENFNYPYISGSIREFWRRWHMSLSGWFQEYLYIPLGGSRKGKIRTVINKFIVFLCTGIWHGANVTFLFWGLYHGCFLMLEEIVPAIREQGGKVKSFFQHVYTLLVVLIGFVFFRADSMHQGAAWIKTMFTGFGSNTAAMSLALEQLTPLYLVTAAVGIVACCPVKMLVKKGRAYEAVTAAGSLALLLLCMLSLASGTYNPFIYFRF